MKAAVFYGGTDIRVEDMPTPEPAPGEALIRVRSGGVCGSDLHPYRGQYPNGLREPHQRGHELAGEVVGLGECVTSLQIGQQVGIQAEHLLGCGTCRYCNRGEYHLCPSRGMPHGKRTESHGFSQYDTCVASNCYPLARSRGLRRCNASGLLRLWCTRPQQGSAWAGLDGCNHRYGRHWNDAGSGGKGLRNRSSHHDRHSAGTAGGCQEHRFGR